MNDFHAMVQLRTLAMPAVDYDLTYFTNEYHMSPHTMAHLPIDFDLTYFTPEYHL